MSNKFLSQFGVCVLCLLFAVTEIRAVIISPFPGLDELIERADAIVILRVDEHVSPMIGPDLYSVHRCLIRQSLNGDIEPQSRMVVWLMDTRRNSFERPFSLLSTHLVFLRGDRSGSGAEYRTMPIEGANIRLSPLGHERMPDGETTADRIRSLIEASMAYWEKVERADRTFMEKFIDGRGDEEDSDQRDGNGEIPAPSDACETSLFPQELEVFESVRSALDRYPGNLGMDAELELALAVTPESEVGLLPEVHEAPLRWIHLDIEHPLSIPSYASIPLKEGPVGGDPFAFQDEKSGAMITVFTEYSSAFEFADWIPGELNHPEVKTVVDSLSETLEKSQFDFILRVYSSTPKRLEYSRSLREKVENLILLRLKALLFRSVRPDTLKVFQGDDRRVLLAEPTEMTVTAGEKTTFGWVVVELEGRPNVFLISGGFQTTPDPEELSKSLLAIAASVRANLPP